MIDELDPAVPVPDQCRRSKKARTHGERFVEDIDNPAVDGEDAAVAGLVDQPLTVRESEDCHGLASIVAVARAEVRSLQRAGAVL